MYKKSTFYKWYKRHEKNAPIIFFIGGFIFDTLTLGRIDRTYDMVMLCLYMFMLSLCLYLYNLADDGTWKGTFLEKYESYLPMAIQFFFGGLSSAYVIYFSRSVSLTKTATFFIILVILFAANEFLKQRISNKYLQFSIYFFLSFTFFGSMLPVFVKEMTNTTYIISGGIALGCTLFLALLVYSVSPSTRRELELGRLLSLILILYASVNTLYLLRLIPPVPLALEEGLVAHQVKVADDHYLVTVEKPALNIFWRKYSNRFTYRDGERVYIFSSVFAPSALKESIIHQWNWYNTEKEKWEIVDNIEYEITGGRDTGYRGFTYKSNVWTGQWKVEVITNENHILGVVGFEIVKVGEEQPRRLVTRKF